MNNTPPKEELLKAIQNTNNIHEVASHFNVSWSTVRCWIRWSGIEIRPNKEQLAEDCLTMTDKLMATKYKVSDKTITKWKKGYQISKKAMSLEALPKILSEEQQDVIIGKLLGDGYLSRPQSDSCNSSFELEHSLAQEEYLRGINKTLQPFSLAVRYRSRNNPFKTEDHHAGILNSCVFQTKRNPVFTELRKKWYPDGIKIVPEELELSWRSIAIWYCDDGCNQIGNRCCRRHGILCTNSFTETEVERLVAQLNKKGIESKITQQINNKNEQSMIHLHKDTFMDFLDQVQEYIPWMCMQYKLKRNEL